MLGVEIARCLFRSSHTFLDLSANCIRDAGAEALASAVRLNPNLIAIVLRSNDIGPDGGASLLRAIGQSKSITSVDLSGVRGINRNHIGLKGCRALGEALRNNPCLTSVNIDENGIGPFGMEHLMVGLKDNISPQLLSLASNNLCVAAAEFACLLQQLTSLALGT